MSKNIVLLSDGTGQRGGVGYETNVWSLYKSLVHDNPKQIICYDDGVGSQKSRAQKILSGMTALGLAQNVRDLYSFLIRHWRPEDRIYLFGFSRGAFTVRILSDLIDRCGIIRMDEDISSENQLDKLVKSAYVATLKAYYRPEYASAFKKNYSWEVKPHIQFIGVWDTVGAIGLPFKEARFAMHNLIEYGFRGHALNDCVNYAAHAISIDDNRETFHPVVWDERIDNNPERISQTWFSGVHTNIGGGYPKNQLSRVSLKWMIDQVRVADKKAGLPASDCLMFCNNKLETISSDKDAHGRMYNSRSGPATAYRFKPRDMEKFRWSYAEENINIHPSVFERISHNTDGYSPHNLTDQYVSKTDKKIEEKSTFPKGWHDCMSAAKSYNCLQRVIYHLFLLPFVAVVFLVLPWKLLLNGLACLPFFSITIEGFFGPFTSSTELIHYALVIIIGFALTLIVSELAQSRFRKKQQMIASQGWCNLYAETRVNEPELLKKTQSSVWIRFSEWLQRTKVLKHYERLVTVVIYCFSYTFGMAYKCCNWLFIQKPRLATIGDSSTGFVYLKSGESSKLSFETSMYRMHTGVYLEKGLNYRVYVDKTAGWVDETFPATPDGLKDTSDLPDFMKKIRKFTRLPQAEIFTLLGEIDGQTPFIIGTEHTFECHHYGELVLYVNDVSFWPFRDFFYGNNKGSARIKLERL